jgi:hypothetical protein
VRFDAPVRPCARCRWSRPSTSACRPRTSRVTLRFVSSVAFGRPSTSSGRTGWCGSVEAQAP